MPGTFFGWDVAVLKASQGATTRDFLTIFTDCELSNPVETDRARAAYDLAGGVYGFDCDVPKSRGFTLRLGAVCNFTNTGDAACQRGFGWDMVTLSIGGTSILQDFVRATVRITNETVQARATYDTAPSPAVPSESPRTAPGVDGWTYPSIGHRQLEIEIEAVVNLATLFEKGIVKTGTSTGPSWQKRLVAAYNLAGGGLSLTGTGVITESSLRIPAEGASQTIRLMGHGDPTLTWTAGTDPGMLLTMALSNQPWNLLMTQPGVSATVYGGQAVITEASFEAPDGACLQGATFASYGPLDIVTAPTLFSATEANDTGAGERLKYVEEREPVLA